MCGRFNFTPSKNQAAQAIFDQLIMEYPDSPIKTGEIFPTNTCAVQTESGLRPMAWGLPKWTGSGTIINARQETAAEKPTFKTAYRETRCIIPTTGFYEWSHTPSGRAKDKFLFFEEAPLLYLAGLWKVVDGVPYYAILTTSANQSMQAVHNRMPVIIDQQNIELYLKDFEAAQHMAGSVQPQLLKEKV